MQVNKRLNHKDVFAQLAEQDGPPDDETATATADVETDTELVTELLTPAEAGGEIAAGAGESAAGQAEPAIDSTDADAAEDDKTGEAVQVPRARRLLRRVAIVAAGAVFIAALGAAGFLGWQVKQAHDDAAAGRAALGVARSYAVTLTSIDTNSIDQNFAQVLNGATGQFKDLYGQSSAQLRQVLIDNKAVSHGTVVDAAIKSATKTKVEVLLFIDQSISNLVNPQPRIDRSRVTMTMELIDNRWLASKVDIT